jgi:adenosylmethionine-8-amino-7-oxononanoate aminotransferase
MATTEQAVSQGNLQELAKRHLWMHFTRLGAYADHDVPIIARGEGCHVWDEKGNRYFDGLSALFCVNIGHGRADVAQAGADQAKELEFFTNWSYAHPRAIELAARIAGLAPGDLNRVFFTSGGSEAVESAIKLSRQYHKLTGKPNKTKIVAREIAYHGTSLGALAATGITPLREPFEPLTPGGVHVPNTNLFRLAPGMLSESDLAEAVAHKIEFEGPDTVAAVIMEPVQNAGGCFTPPEGYWQRVREICTEYDVLLISDEVICSWGRLGHWFGAERYDYVPDLITTAKGITSAYAPMGALIASDRVAEPFLKDNNSFVHGFTFAGHPISCAVSLANIDVLENEGILENVRTHEGAFRDMLESLRDIPIVGDVRGAGYFHAIELVKDRDKPGESGRGSSGGGEAYGQFSDEESETLLRGFLSGELFKRGLICRADDRGDPVIQLSPPLIAGPEEFAEIESVLRPVLEEATERMNVGG